MVHHSDDSRQIHWPTELFYRHYCRQCERNTLCYCQSEDENCTEHDQPQNEPGGADVDDGLLSPGPSAGPHHLSVRAGGVVSGGTGGTAGDHEGCTSRPLINSGAKVTDPGAKRSDPGAKSTDPGTKRTDPGAKSYDLGTESTDQGTKSTESGTVPCHICDH